MATLEDDDTFSGSSSNDESVNDAELSKKTSSLEDFSDLTLQDGVSSVASDVDFEEDEEEAAVNSSDTKAEKDDPEDAPASEDGSDTDENAYKRYEMRSSFNHARIEIDEDYEEDLGFPMYYAGYTHRKKQLPIGMDCWKVKTIPVDPELLKEMIEDQKVRRELLVKTMEEIAKEKNRLLQLLSEQQAS